MLHSFKLNLFQEGKIVQFICPYLMFLMFLFLSPQVYSQVTIGSGVPARNTSILDLKESDSSSGVNSKKGLLLPRVNLTDKSQLYPMFLIDPKDPTSGSTAKYSSNKKELDNMHIGLLVFNLHEDISNGLYYGLNSWDGTQWVSLMPK